MMAKSSSLCGMGGRVGEALLVGFPLGHLVGLLKEPGPRT